MNESVLTQRKREDFSTDLAKKGWYHSIELPDGRRIEGFLELDELRERWARFPLPANLAGKRVLDIGTWDGWFAFEAERRGAEVVALDNVEQENFHYAHRELRSKVEYHVADVYDVLNLGLGSFDYTLFLGVLYHLRHPLRALELVCALTKEIAIVDSFVVDPDSRGAIDSPLPWMEFYETNELSNQIDNWWGPTVQCLLALCRSAGFARVELLGTKHRHAQVACYRYWEPVPPSPKEEAPTIQAVANARFGDNGINFSARREEFLTCWFSTRNNDLRREDLRLEVSRFGTIALALKPHGDGEWQANFMLPPGLDPGWHEVRLRTSCSTFSGAIRIAVALPVESRCVTILGACDGLTWLQGEVAFAGELAHLTLWVGGLGENADRNNVRVYCDAQRLHVDFVSAPDSTGTRQVNARISKRTGVGIYTIVVRFGETQSPPVEVQIRNRRLRGCS